MSSQFVVSAAGGVPAGSYNAKFAGLEAYTENADRFGEGVLLAFKIIGGDLDGESVRRSRIQILRITLASVSDGMEHRLIRPKDLHVSPELSEYLAGNAVECLSHNLMALDSRARHCFDTNGTLGLLSLSSLPLGIGGINNRSESYLLAV
ncbi:hypothetical protein CKO51_11725 [Rhodopirellula sp. SM50]|nr:hypothetical protein [Rhodopirellula sp. SM50]PAY19278.1 hypothetical protein CKO51_11725 [Rhodopirellula sp. SM50]